MAAVTFTKSRVVTPVAYEYNVRGVLTEDVVAGTLLRQSSTGYGKNPTTGVLAHGIALQDGALGETIDVGKAGEQELIGAAMTPGVPLYPSGATAGGIDTTAVIFYTAATTPAVNVPVQPQMRALTATRILYNFLP